MIESDHRRAAGLRRRLFSRGGAFSVGGAALFFLGAIAFAQDSDEAAPAPAAPTAATAAGLEGEIGVVKLEGVRAKVLNGDRVAFLIAADRGDLFEDSREIHLRGPQVRIFDAQGQPRDEVSGERGRLWPETIEERDEDGNLEEETKYNWQLDGEVDFASMRGQKISTPSLVFSRAENLIYSDQGVEYRIPGGEGSTLSGTAAQFRSQIDPVTNAIQTWTLLGDVLMHMEKEAQ